MPDSLLPGDDPGARLPLDLAARIGAPLDPAFAETVIALASLRAPDFIIGSAADPYIRRWYLARDAVRGAVYLHQILRSDDDRALHDHPTNNVSVILRGSYVEVEPEYGADPKRGPFRETERRAGDVLMRPGAASHRLVVAPGAEVWTLFICGPVIREWGFHCPQGWRRWQDFVAPDNAGAVGRGCGD